MSAVDDLFGSDDEEQPEPSPAPRRSEAEDKKAKMLALIAKKREREEEEAGKPKKSKKQKGDKGGGEKRASKKAKKGSGTGGGGGGTGTAALLGGIDFGDEEDEEDDEDWAAGEGDEGGSGEEGDDDAARAGSRRQAALAERAAAAAEREANRIELDENDERNRIVTEEDRAFIDDTDVAPDEQIDWGEEEEEQNLAQYEEAQEAGEEDEFEAMFNKKKRRDGGELSAHEAKVIVEGLLSAMEIAVEEDHKAYEQGRPAVEKLKLLPRVQDVLSTKRLHSELLDAGVLGVLKAWIEPMSDGTLPNAKVRETVLRLLHTLPVDCSMEDRKEQLKKSGLGRIVMFLFKLPDETAANRRLAKELVERWSRPILAPNRARDLNEEERERILLARQQRQAKAAAQAAAAALQAGGGGEEEGDGRPRQPKFGEAGFRFHASIPQAAALDYVKAPSGRFGMPEKKAPGKGGKDEHKLTKKLATMAKTGRAGRAAVASVEGRNVTIQH